MSRQLSTLCGIEYEVDEATGCWEWLKGKTESGYPFSYAHRKYWEAVNGPRPADHDIHHTCRNPGCVNPDHLEAIHHRAHDVEHLLTARTGLTLQDIRDIRELGKVQGMRAADVAERYGLNEITVYEYWSAYHWGDLLGDTEKVLPVRTCPRCGTVFKDRQRSAIYCSKRCQQYASVERKRERKAA